MSLIPAAASVTELRARGYSLIPTPQRLELQETDLTVEPTWGLTLQNVDRDDIAVQTLLAGLRDHGLELQGTADAASQFRLAIRQDAVTTNTDPERQAQAYLLQMRPTAVEIVGNTAQGLFYGVQTVLQLLKPIGPARLALPAGTIRDWPAYQLRILHWDTKHHQDRIETLKRYLDWSARFKINAIAWELEDKFEYPSHPVIGAPGAFTTAQIQELVRYGLQRYIQIIPDIQAPAHMAYVLKHPEFAHLRSDGSNYQICMCCDEAIRLIFDMYQDVLEATEGVDYFFVSTDEVYYAGIDPRCQRPYNPLNRSLTWVEFVNRAHRFLSERGRRVLIWAEYPLLTEHVHLLPPDIIDGIIGGNEEFIRAENQRGIRQLAYVPIQGSEKLFPNYFTYQRHGQPTPGRLAAVYEGTLRGKASRGNPIGTFAAAWDDAGLHNETFWLGWATMAQYAWTPGTPSLEQTVTEFMEIYYGPNISAAEMVEAYRSLQRGARFWEDSWRRVKSKVRPPAYGSSRGKGIGTRRTDLTLTPPQLPALPDLKIRRRFSSRHAQALSEAPQRLHENERLIYRLQANLARASRNRYNLQVLLALAYFQRQFIDMLLDLNRIEDTLLQAARAEQTGQPQQAVGLLLQAHQIAGQILDQLDRTYSNLKATFERSRYPKGRSVDGRHFVHIMDDVKDHFADRRADLSFMIAPHQSLQLDAWRQKLARLIRAYAARHDIALKPLPEQLPED